MGAHTHRSNSIRVVTGTGSDNVVFTYPIGSSRQRVLPAGGSSRPSDRSGGDEHRAIEQVANGTEQNFKLHEIQAL